MAFRDRFGTESSKSELRVTVEKPSARDAIRTQESEKSVSTDVQATAPPEVPEATV